ncbi:Right handed beta helix region [Candidatus Anstonella stagnisolia]|nr:Right handed beta helix region [Candidatus Anstonella stagnisolia]
MYSIYLTGTSGANISSVTLASDSVAGIYLDSSSNSNSITSPTISTLGSGIYVNSGSGNTIDCLGANLIGSNASSTYGIYSTQTNTTVQNCNISNFQHGIYFTGANGTILNNNASTTYTGGVGIFVGGSRHTVKSNTAYSYSDAAIRVDTSNYNVLANNNGTSDTTNNAYGLYIVSGASHNVVANSTFTSNGGSNSRAVFINTASSTNNSLINVTARGTSGQGIMASANGNYILNSTGISVSEAGIWLSGSSNNTITNSAGASNSNVGIELTSGSNNNIITNSNGSSNASANSYGYYLSASSNNQIINPAASSNFTHAIYLLSNANNNTFNLTRGILTNKSAVYINSGANNTIDCLGANLIGSNATTTYGVYSSQSNTTVRNCNISNFGYGISFVAGADNGTIQNTNASSTNSRSIYIISNGNSITNSIANSTNDIGLYLAGASNNTVTNSIGASVSSIGIYVQAAAKNNVLINCTGISSSQAAIAIYDNANNTQLINSTGTTASAKGIYVYLSSNVSISNSAGRSTANGYGIDLYTVTSSQVTNSNAASNSSYGMLLTTSSTNNQIINSTAFSNASHAIYITSASSNNALNLTNGITTNLSAVYIDGGASNSIDCQGANLIGSNATTTYGVYSTQSNTTIKNCNISNFATGIYFNGAANGTIDNVNASTTYDYDVSSQGNGIYLYNNATFNSITNSNANSLRGVGIRLSTDADYNTIANNTVTSTYSYGILLVTNSNQNNITNSRGTTTSGIGGIAIGINSNYNTLTNSTGVSSSGYGIYVTTSANNSFYNSTFSSTSSLGINLSSSPNNYFENVSNSILSGAGGSFKFYSDSAQNTSSKLNIGWWPLLTSNGATATVQANTAFYNGSSGGRNADGSSNTNLHYWYNNQPLLGIVLNAPPNEIFTSNRVPAFNFTATSGVNSTFTCTLALNNTPYGTNATTTTAVATLITANASLADGKYFWYVNCTDPYGTMQSEIRNITIDATPPAIAFVSPTDANASYVNRSFSYVNVSVSDTNNVSAFIDWNRSLVGWYRFNGANDFNDYSTYSNIGINSGSAYNDSGAFGSSRTFDGASNYVTVPYAASLAPTGAITVSAWFSTKDKTVAQKIVSKTEGGAYALGLNLGVPYCNANSICLLINVGGTYYNASYATSNINNNQWYHMVGTYDGETARLYVNGAEVASNTNPSGAISYASSNPLCIGSEPDGTVCSTGQYFNGSIDDVAIFSRNLSTQEILALYNANANSLYNNFTGLAGTYNYIAYSQDAAGNTNSTENRTLIVDTVAPSISFVPPTPNDNSSVSSLDGTVYVNVSSSDNYANHSVVTDWNRTLIGWYRFNDANDFTDYSSYGANGINAGSAYNASGMFGGARQFDGAGSLVNVTGAPNPTDALTIEAWVYPKKSEIKEIFLRGTGSTANYEFHQSGLNLVVYLNDRATSATSASAMALNAWNHIVFTYDKSLPSANIKMYINGVQDATTKNYTASLATTTYPFAIGAYPDLRYPFNGTIDDVQVYKRALSAQEISASYNAATFKYYNNFTGLTAGDYTVKSYAQDFAGNVNSTETRTFSVKLQCGTLGAANTVYTLTSNVSIAGATCFTVTAKNVTLDCNGYSISGDNTSSTSGVYSTYANTTVKNCRISDFNFAVQYATGADFSRIDNTIGSSTGSAFYMNTPGNLVISNSTASALTTATAAGVNFAGGSNSVAINTTGIGVAAGTYGMKIITAGSNNSFINCNATSTSSYGMLIQRPGNFVINTTAYSGGSLAIYLTTATANNNVLNLTRGISTTNSGVYIDGGANNSMDCQGANIIGNSALSSYGVYSDELNTTIKNCNISNFQHGIYFLGAASGAILNTNASTTQTGASYGIYLYSNANSNQIINSSGTSSAYSGIMIYTSSSNIVNGSRGTSLGSVGAGIHLYSLANGNQIINSSGASASSSKGILVDTSSSNQIINSTATSSTGDAIYLTGSSSNNITNVTATTASGTTGCAIHLVSSSNGNRITSASATNTVGAGNVAGGIYVESSSSNIINATSASGGAGNGIYLLSSSSNNQVLNSNATGAGVGLYVSTGSNNNNITNSRGTTGGGGYAAYIYDSNNTRFENNTMVATSTGYGMRLWTAWFNTLVGNNITSNSNYALWLSASSNNVSNSSMASTSNYAIHIQGSNNNIINATATSGTFTSIYLTSGSNNTITNSTVSGTSGITATNLSSLNLFYYNNVSATTYVNNSNETNQFNTSVAGVAQGNYYTNILIVNIYDSDGDGYGDMGSAYPYNASSSGSSWLGLGADYGPIAARSTALSACANLSIAGATYTLRANITGAAGTCFNITAANITLNGQGNSISGINNSNTYGVHSNQFNSTISSIRISSFPNAVRLNGATYATIADSILSTFYGGVIRVTGASNNTIARNNTISLFSTVADAGGIYNDGGANMNVDCQGASITGINGSSTYGIYSNQFNTTITNCRISSFQHGVYFTGATNGSISNTNATSFIASGSGIALTNANDNIVTNTITNSTLYPGTWLSGTSTRNTIRDSLAQSLANQPGLEIDSNSNTVLNATGKAGGASYGGIGIYGGSSNSITNSTGINTVAGGIGISITAGTANSNTIIGSYGNATDGSGIYISSGSHNFVDCQGKTLIGTNATNTYGVYTNQINTTVKNCIISNFSIGVFFSGATFGTINNVTASTSRARASDSNGDGIFLTNSANDNIIINSSATATGGTSIGILLDGNNLRNQIINTTGYGASGNGIILYSNSAPGNQFNNITNSTGISGSVSAISLSWYSTNNRVSGSNGTSTSSNGISLVIAANNSVSNSSFASTSGYGMTLSSSFGNNITGSNITSASNIGIVLTASNSSRFTNNTISASTAAINISSASSLNLFYYNNITASVWVNSTNASNYFNTSVGGHAQGNIYNGIWAYDLRDADADNWADLGTQYPLSSSTVPARWIGLGADYGPWTNRTNTAPVVVSAYAGVETNGTNEVALAAYWRLDEAQSDPIAVDSASGAWPGTPTNVNFTAQGRIGRAASFNSTGAHISIGTFNVSSTQFAAVSGWFKANSVALPSQVIFDNRQFYVALQQSKINYRAYGGGTWGSKNSSATIKADTWYHFVVSYDGYYNSHELALYLNGALDSDMQFPDTISRADGATGQIGTDYLLTSPFGGMIDDVRAFNRSFSADDALRVYNNTAYRLYTLAAAPNATDADGDALTFNYTWYKNGLVFGSTNSSSFNVSPSSISIGDNWGACIIAYDGSSYSSPACSPNLTIVSSAPAIAFQNTYVNCTIGHCFNVTAGATSQLALQGLQLNNTANGACTNAYNTSRGTTFNATYNCSGPINGVANISIGFNGFDGWAWSTYSTNAFPNQPPTQGTPILNSTDASNSTVGNLTAYNVSFADVDNDSLYAIYDMRRNGVSLAMANLPFDRNVSSTTAGAVPDYSTYASNGTLGGGTAAKAPVWNASGKVGGAYTFDGVNDDISAGANANVLDKFTLAAWVYQVSTSGPKYQTIINHGGQNANGEYWLYLTDGKISIEVGNGTGRKFNEALTSAPLGLNTWHYVIVTFDQGTVTTYINGTQSGSASLGIASSLGGSQTLYIGAYQGSSNVFNGSIDGVLVFNRTLSAAQVAALYDSQYSKLASQELAPGENWSVSVAATDQYAEVANLSNNVTITSSLSACGVLNVPNTAFNLTGSVSINGSTCFNVTAQNITLDCTGYSVSGDNTTSTYGIYSNQFNTAIKNCNISNFATGIYFSGATNGTIQNTNASSTNAAGGLSGKGLRFDSGANNSQIINVTATADWGIIIAAGSNNNAFSGTIASSSTASGRGISIQGQNTSIDCQGKSMAGANATGSYGIYSDSFNTTIKNCQISSFQHGIYLQGSNSSTIQNTNASTTALAGYGIYLSSSNNSAITNSMGNSTLDSGICLLSSPGISLTYSIGSSNQLHGILITGTSVSDSLSNSTGISSQGHGIYINSSSTGNTLADTAGASDAGDGIAIMSNSNIGANITGTSNSLMGILINAGDYNSISNSNGTSVSSNGIYLNNSANSNNLTNSIGGSTSGYGIILNSTSLNSIQGSRGISASSAGIFIDSTTSSTINSSNGTSTSSVGIYIYPGSTGVIVNNSIGTSNASIAIYLYAGANRLENSAGISVDGAGVQIRGDSNTLNSVTASSASDYGIYLYSGSDYNNLTGVVVYSNATYGLAFATTKLNRIANTTASSNVSYGLYLTASNNMTFINVTCISNVTFGAYLTTSNNNTFSNGSFYSRSGSGLYLATNSSANIFENNTINASANGIYLIASSHENLFDHNYVYRASTYVNNSNETNSFNISVAGVAQGNYYDNIAGVNIFDGDNDGYGDYGSAYPYNASTNGTDWKGIGADWGPIGARSTSLSACAELNIAGATYNVTADITGATGTCFNITAQNVTLNGQGHSVKGVNGTGGVQYGVYSNQPNSVLLNLNLSNFAHAIYLDRASSATIQGNNASSTYATGYGIYLSLSNSSLISSNIINATSTALRMESLSNSNNATGNTIVSGSGSAAALLGTTSSNRIIGNTIAARSSGYGIWVNSSNSNTIANNSATSVTGYGIAVVSSSSTLLQGNNATSGSSGIYLSSASSSTLTGNNCTSTSTSSADAGIYLLGGSSNTVENNTAYGPSGASGVYASGGSLNRFAGNNATAAGLTASYGIYIAGGSTNTILRNNATGSGTASYGMYLTTSTGNTIANNTANGGSSSIVLDISSTSNTLTNNTATSTGTGYGIGLLTGSNSNTLTNNRGISTGAGASNAGIAVLSSANNGFTNNTANSSYGPAIRVESGANGNTFTNNSAYAMSNYSMFIYSSTGTNAVRNFLFSNNSGGLYLGGSSSGGTFTNNTINASTNGIMADGSGSGSNFFYYNYIYRATTYVDNSANSNQFNTSVGGAAQGNYYENIASVAIYDSDGNGYGDSGADYPYGTTTTGSKWKNSGADYGPINATNTTLSACADLNATGATYTLAADITGITTDCFRINAANVTLEGSGHLIAGTNGSVLPQYGVYSTQFNSTVKNIKVQNFTTDIYFNGAANGTIRNTTTFLTSSDDFAHGIMLVGTENTTIANNNATCTVNAGIFLAVGSRYNYLANNSGTSVSSTGIQIQGSSNNTLSNCTGTSTSGNGIVLYYGASGTAISNSKGISSSGFGIDINGSSNVIMTNSNGTSDTQHGIHVVPYLAASQRSDNIAIINSTGTSTNVNGLSGIYVSGLGQLSVTGISIINSTGTSQSQNDANGINLGGAADSSIISSRGTNLVEGNGIFLIDSTRINITNSFGNSTTHRGIDLWNATFSTLQGNNGTSGNGTGILVYSWSGNNTLANNRGTSTSYYGIHIMDYGNNLLANNTATSGSGIALYIDGSENNTLINNTAISDTGYGAMLYLSNGNSLASSSIRSNGLISLLLDHSNSNAVANNSASVTYGAAYQIFPGAAIELNYSHNNNFTNNNATSDSDSAVMISYSENNTIADSYAATSGTYDYAFLASYSNRTSILRNTIVAINPAWIGLSVQSSDFASIMNNTVISAVHSDIIVSGFSLNTTLSGNTNSSINLYQDIGATVSNNTCTALDCGLILAETSQSTVADNYISRAIPGNETCELGYDFCVACGSDAVCITSVNAGANNNVFTNNTIYGQPGNGLYVYQSDNNQFTNNNFSSLIFYGVELLGSNNTIIGGSAYSQNLTPLYVGADIPTSPGANNTFRNMSITTANSSTYAVVFEPATSYNLFYWNNISATKWVNNSNSTNQFNTSVGGYPQGNFYPNASSYNIVDTNLDGFADSGAQNPFGNATIGSGLWMGNGADYGPYAPDNIGCQNLSDAGRVYNLNVDAVSTSGTCFTATAANITLDCQGHSITGVNLSSTYGFTTNQINTTVKNCIISNFSHAIYWNTADNGSILNNIANTSRASSYGIYIYSGANFNLIANNTADSRLSYGIYVSSSHNNTLVNNTAYTPAGGAAPIGLSSSNSNRVANNNATTNTSSATYGAIYLTSASYNTIANNTATSNSGGIVVSSSTYNNLTNNTAISVGNTAIASGFYISSSSTGNALTNNFGTTLPSSTSKAGIYITGSNNMVLANNTGISNRSYGIYLSSTGTTITGGNASSNATYGLYLASASSNDIINVNATSRDSNPVYLTSSSNNEFYNMTVDATTASQAGIYLTGSSNNYFRNVTNSYSYNSTSAKFYSSSAQNASSNMDLGWWPHFDSTGADATTQANTAWFNGTGGGRDNNWNTAALNTYWYRGNDRQLNIYFVSPTPADKAATTNTTLPANITINESGLDTFTWNWNSTNFTFYDGTLVYMANFDNVAAFGEGSVSSVAADVSQGANTGTCKNMGTSCNWTSGQYGSAIHFDGSDDFVNVTYSASFEPSTAVTFGGWLKVTGDGTDSDGDYVLSKGRESSTLSYGLKYVPATDKYSCMVSLNTNGAYTVNSTSTFPPPSSSFTHVMCVYDTSALSLKIYVNGVNEATTSTGTGGSINYSIMGDRDLHIGNGQTTTPMRQFQGDIDEPRIYSRALSATEVAQQYYSDLYKPSQTQWQFYTVQPMAKTSYYYSGYAKEFTGIANSTGERQITRN